MKLTPNLITETIQVPPSQGKPIELWCVERIGKQVLVDFLDYYSTAEEAEQIATTLGTGHYHICTERGNLYEFDVTEAGTFRCLDPRATLEMAN